MFRFFQQLGAAGLIKGSYIGTDATNAGYINSTSAGINVPEARQNGYAYNTRWQGRLAGSTQRFGGNLGHYIQYFYAPAITTGAANVGAFTMTPADMLRFDTKFDDGLPGTGMINSWKGDGTTTFCTTAAGVAPPGDAGATYNLSDTNQDCGIFWLRVF